MIFSDRNPVKKRINRKARGFRSFYGIIIKIMMQSLAERITINPKQCGGRPCVRGMRIRVTDVLDLFAAGLTAEQILEEMPDLEREDLQACLQYAARKLNHAVLIAA
jgi:uncharacterized protein (DUF433 family)